MKESSRNQVQFILQILLWTFVIIPGCLFFPIGVWGCMYVFEKYMVLDDVELTHYSLCVVLPLCCIGVACSIVAFYFDSFSEKKNTVETFREKLFGSLFFGLISSFILVVESLILTHYINGAFDRGNPVIHHAQVVGKRYAFKSIPPTLTLRSLHPTEPEIASLEVSKDFYDQATEGKTTIEVVTKPGLLGSAWRVSYRIAPPEVPQKKN